MTETTLDINATEQPVRRQERVVYCHFSFKRPSDVEYGLFAVAFYNDFEGKKLIGHLTKRQPLWENQQFVTAIQSYAFALQCIFEAQGKMKELGITQVLLVTDNSTLEGWIINPKKNKAYTEHMNRAVNPFRVGSPKEIVLGIGLCEARKAEKSYKYCREDLAINTIDTPSNSGVNKIDIGTAYKNALDILSEDPATPTVSGMEPLSI